LDLIRILWVQMSMPVKHDNPPTQQQSFNFKQSLDILNERGALSHSHTHSLSQCVLL